LDFRLFSGPSLYERTGKHPYLLGWGEPPKTTPKEAHTPVDLDSIQVLPGEYFQTEV
jgi:hypothetical protein